MNKKALRTEMRNPNTTHIDQMCTERMLRVMNAENRRPADAVEEVIPALIPLIDHIAEELSRGGRIIYAGAGTSGRIGAMDAAECPPTFGVSPETVTALIAGGEKSLSRAAEAAEDCEEAGIRDLSALHPGQHDTVIGISAAGGAAYVIGVLKTAREAGAATASVCCNSGVPMEQWADWKICVDTGPEAITGSTRLKAGTAQKLILNLISTAVMIKTGKVLENFMINVRPTNAKLLRRAAGIVAELTGAQESQAAEALDQAGGSIRDAVSHLKRL